MRPDARFQALPKAFWANVRSISERLGYTDRRDGTVKAPILPDVIDALSNLGLGTNHLLTSRGRVNKLGTVLLQYFEYRAQALNESVEPCLMSANEAQALFKRLRADLCPECPLPMNKQKGDKRAHAYFTGIINMLIEANAEGLPCDFSPRRLTTITRGGVPIRTMSRWVDGAFPGPVNPVAVWEIKEYYYTTTFGSRVADGVYETLLDGMEIEELRKSERIDVKHYLMVDDRCTWWECGRSYLCRIIDMLHMGYVDEVLFGREVMDRLPQLTKQWVNLVRDR